MVSPDTRHEHPHPGPTQYIEIAVILGFFTALEVVLYEGMRRGLIRAVAIPGIIVLTILKFALVVLWFMHLRFDHRLFRRIFLTGLLLAVAVFAVVGATFAFGGI